MKWIIFVDASQSLFIFFQENWPYNALELAEVMFKAFSDVAKTTYGRGNATPAQFAMQVSDKTNRPFNCSEKESQSNDVCLHFKLFSNLHNSGRSLHATRSNFACKNV